MKLFSELSKKVFVLLLILISSVAIGQDLECDVVVDASQIETQDRRVFQDMEKAFEDFLNGRDWANDEFKPEERIKCTIAINLVEMPSIGNFRATVQIRSSRPIYNSTYESILFNFADRDWNFTYIESQPLLYNENSYSTNLTSILAFYAFVIIGIDYDSFGELSGSVYFQQAQNIVTQAAQSNNPGWSGLESTRNRYALIDDLTNQRLEEMRTGYYRYHRLGLDIYDTKPDDARKEILTMLQAMKAVKIQYPASILVISFFDAKASELVNIFSDGSIGDRRTAYNLLMELNPSKGDIYSKIIN